MINKSKTKLITNVVGAGVESALNIVPKGTEIFGNKKIK